MTYNVAAQLTVLGSETGWATPLTLALEFILDGGDVIPSWVNSFCGAATALDWICDCVDFATVTSFNPGIEVSCRVNK